MKLLTLKHFNSFKIEQTIRQKCLLKKVNV